MRILHILDHSLPLHSGYSFRTLSILREQRRLGWETAQLTGGKQGSKEDGVEEAEGLKFFRTACDDGALGRLPVFNQYAIVTALTRRILEVAEDWQPQILHAHSPALNGLAALRAGRRLGIPVVYEVRAFWEDAAVDHGTTREGSLRYRLTRRLESRVLRKADAVTTICEGLKREIEGRGIGAKNVTVIPNAVDIERFEHAAGRELPAALGRKLRDAVVLAFIGSFYAYEGLDLLLKALPRIRERHPQTQVLLVGGGPQEDALKRLSASLDIEDAVTFAGRVAPVEVPAYYHAADLLVYPRRSMRLTELVTPLKPLEAMAYGRPVLASDVGGHRELIRPQENGVLFKSGDAEDLAVAVSRLHEHPETWKAMIAAGKAFVRSERNWKVSVARYQGVYSRALGSAVAIGAEA